MFPNSNSWNRIVTEPSSPRTRGVTRTILGGFTKRNVSLGGSGGMLPQKNFENYDSTSVNSGHFLIFCRTSKSDIKMFFEHVLHRDDLGEVHRIMQKLQS